MLSLFRVISFLEGISFLIILSVTLGFISRDYVFYLGMTHGILFMIYLVVSLLVCSKKEWSLLVWLGLFAASLIPFGFVPVEVLLRKNEGKAEARVSGAQA